MIFRAVVLTGFINKHRVVGGRFILKDKLLYLHSKPSTSKCSVLMFVRSDTHQAEQTADLINGAQAANEAHEHGERSDSDQDVAGDLYSGGVI